MQLQGTFHELYRDQTVPYISEDVPLAYTLIYRLYPAQVIYWYWLVPLHRREWSVNKKVALRATAAALLLDGLGLLVFGQAYARLWRLGPRRSAYRKTASWFANLPASILRLIGFAESALGLILLGQVPVSVRALYRAVAGFYDELMPVWVEGYPGAYQALDDALRSHLPAGGRVLDLGCGTGANLQRLLDLGLPFGEYVGVDISPDMLAQARQKFAGVENATFRQLDVLHDPLPRGSFDLIISTWVFEHLPEPSSVAWKAWERLGPGGHMVLFFEVWDDTWRSRVTEPVWRFFNAHLLREGTYCKFPGVASVDCFGGLWTSVALLISNKPAVE